MPSSAAYPPAGGPAGRGAARGTWARASGASPAATTVVIQNDDCQPASCSSRAPAIGAAAGITLSQIASHDMALTVSASPKRWRITPGTTTAAAPTPNPWTARATISAASDGASAQARPAITCSISAVASTVRAPYRSAAYPQISCDRASVAVKTASVAWACGIVPPSAAGSWGKAGRYRSVASMPTPVTAASGSTTFTLARIDIPANHLAATPDRWVAPRQAGDLTHFERDVLHDLAAV